MSNVCVKGGFLATDLIRNWNLRETLKLQPREVSRQDLGPGAQAVGEEDAQAAEEQQGVPVASGDARAGQIAAAEARKDRNLQDTEMRAAEVKDNGMFERGLGERLARTSRLIEARWDKARRDDRET